jgi:hypothetical protein
MADTKVPEPVKSFVIDRLTWYRGHGSSASKLLREDGKMCCVGIYGRALGVPDAYLLNLGTVSNSLGEKDPYGPVPPPARNLPWPEWTIKRQHGDLSDLYTVNDYQLAMGGGGKWEGVINSEADREAVIAKLFAKNGVTVTFIN